MTSRKEARSAMLGLGLTAAPRAPELADVNSGAGAADRPPAAEPRPRPMAGAVGAVSRTLGQFRQELKTAQDLVATGAHVVEIDPADIEASILKDRMEVDAASQAILVESIRQSGQQSPVLVRRVAGASARYQLAYGHRRLAACRALGRKVLAIVRDLSDQDLLVAQGQENSSRADLSYIERALFAHNMETRGLPRETIMLALATDKTELSKMISIARAVPAEISAAVGPAPKAGRSRWLGLSERLAGRKPDAALRKFIAADEFRAASTDRRFEMLFKRVQAQAKDRPRSAWADGEGRVLVRCLRAPKAITLAVDNRLEPGFGEFLFAHLDDFYATFLARKGKVE